MSAIWSLTAVPAMAQEAGFQDELLAHLAGTWVLEGAIAGGPSTHDIAAEWVLGHYYLRLHEVSRETEASGAPEYEAIVFIGWDEPTDSYACLWLDSTGGGGLVGQSIGHAKRSGDSIPFVFDALDGSMIHNTFAYHRDTDSWTWTIDVVRGAERSSFAQVTLTRQ